MATETRDMINQFVRGEEGLETHIIILQDQLQVILSSSSFRMTVMSVRMTHLTLMFAHIPLRNLPSESLLAGRWYWAASVWAVVMMVVTSSGDGDMMVTQTPASPLPLSAI